MLRGFHSYVHLPPAQARIVSMVSAVLAALAVATVFVSLSPAARAVRDTEARRLSDEDIDRCFAEARATIAEVRATVAPFERFAPRLG